MTSLADTIVDLLREYEDEFVVETLSNVLKMRQICMYRLEEYESDSESEAESEDEEEAEFTTCDVNGLEYPALELEGKTHVFTDDKHWCGVLENGIITKEGYETPLEDDECSDSCGCEDVRDRANNYTRKSVGKMNGQEFFALVRKEVEIEPASIMSL